MQQLSEIFQNNSANTWVIQVFAVIFVTLTVAFFINRLVRKLHIKLSKTRNKWDDAFAVSIRKPLRALVWIVGVSFAIELIYQESKTPIFSAIYPIRDVAVIAVIAWFVNGFIKEVQHTIFKQKGNIDATTVDAISKILRAAVFITAALIILQTLGFSVSGVLAFGGVGGIAIGFAAKDLLANFFGALMIYFDRPFKVGDWIRSPDRSIEGTVEDIGWRQTRIRTFDQRPLYVPNSVFSTVAVENPSRMTHRRIYETIGVRYDDMAKIEKILTQIKDMLIKHKEIDESQTLMVNLNEFSASSVDFFVYTFTHTTDWIKFHEIKQDVLLKISNIIEKNEAEIAFPTSTLHIPEKITIGA